MDVKRIVKYASLGIAAICTIVGVAIYAYTIGWINSYWVADNNPVINGFSGWAIAFFVIVVAATVAMQFFGSKWKHLGIIANYVTGALTIVAVCFVFASLVGLIGDRVEGLGYILFSDDTVKAQVQTEANLTSVSLTITSCVFYGIAGVFGIVSAFFNAYDEKEEAAEAAA